ncbi:DegT/DnrJ/EryC1/StrS family aminotransferase [Cerasicoccus frondis]|uniref:DegT/DnrJ/EryC1/StrS family aminotransferase n=1 Tax=Cerasicoccus frondis TaxID=490090 RepID=UPI00285299CC|nr:DegT/DnrJ/EryC1/StrS family aminotransferase [Cerasicoccus frondis]
MTSTKVPLLDVNIQNQPLASELRDAFDRVLSHGRFILGDEVTDFEAAVAAELGVKHAIGVSSGTDALLLALMALDIGPGDEVICPSFSFFATAGAIARTGATPVFADVCPVTFNLDPESTVNLITTKTKAIIPVHLYGQSAPMDELMTIAHNHQLKVIEDAAQSFGAAYRGTALGAIGDFGCFSFFPSKNLGGLGDSGLLTTNDDALADKAAYLRNHGMNPKYYHAMIGGNFRIDALQAALLSVKLPHHRQYSHARAENAAYYLKGLAAHGQPASYDQPESAKLILPTALADNTHIWNQFTLRLPVAPDATSLPRDALKAWLAERDIGSEIYYPVPFNQQECFAHLPKAECPVSDQLAREVLSIPVYPELTDAQLDAVIEGVSEFVATL